MKSKAHQPFYFSAYPLKAITGSSTKAANDSPYLKSVLATGITRSTSRVRVFPMANPYKPVTRVAFRLKPVAQMDARDNGWFNHYE